MYLNNTIIYTAVFFFPFQLLAIRFFTSAYDITSLLFVINILLVSITSLYINKKNILILSIFVILQCITAFYFNIGPDYRFVSGIIWLSSLTLIMANGQYLHQYSQKIVFQLIISLLVITSIFICIEHFFIIDPNTTQRPKAAFSEPSYAGLALYAASAAIVSVIILSNNTRKLLLIFISIFALLMAASIFARSMHVVTFSISLGIIILLWLSYRISFLKLITFLFIIFLTLCLGYILFSNPHYYNRINIFVDPLAMTNPSLLSWLRGLDQVLEVIVNSPFFGYGIGSTGYFDFESAYGERLAYYRMYDLTLKDAFSLLWRLIIEIGLVPIFIFSLFMFYKLREFRLFLINASYNSDDFKYIVFNFTFALALTIGCLIKEPNYARSTLFLGIFLLSTISLKDQKK